MSKREYDTHIYKLSKGNIRNMLLKKIVRYFILCFAFIEHKKILIVGKKIVKIF